jgi:Flp pilus assembly pilin Flp
MAHLYWYLRALLGTWLRDERAQDAWEYLLVVGGVSVAIILAMTAVPGLTDALIQAVCSAIAGIETLSSIQCPA